MGKLEHVLKMNADAMTSTGVQYIKDAIVERDELAARVERLEKQLRVFLPAEASEDNFFEYSEGSEQIGLDVWQLLDEPREASLLLHDAALLRRFANSREKALDSISLGHENRSRGASTYNWESHFCMEIAREASRIEQAAALEGEG
jgi:hypothetical protein